MFVEHYALNQAMSYSVRLMSEKRRFLWTIATVYPLCEAALTALCGFIGVQAVTITLFSVMYLFCMLLIPAVTFRIYFECVGGERRISGAKFSAEGGAKMTFNKILSLSAHNWKVMLKALFCQVVILALILALGFLVFGGVLDEL